MQHVSASDHLTGSAKRAVETALTDAKTQRVGGTPASAPAAAPTPSAVPKATA